MKKVTKVRTKMKVPNVIYALVVSAEKVDRKFIWQVCDGKQLFQINESSCINEEIKVNNLVAVINPDIFINIISKPVMTKIDDHKMRQRILESIKDSDILKKQIRAFNPRFMEALDE